MRFTTGSLLPFVVLPFLFPGAGGNEVGRRTVSWREVHGVGAVATMVFAFSAGIGTAAGIAVDWAIRSRHADYRAIGSRPSLTVAPPLGPRGSGVVACLRW